MAGLCTMHGQFLCGELTSVRCLARKQQLAHRFIGQAGHAMFEQRSNSNVVIAEMRGCELRTLSSDQEAALRRNGYPKPGGETQLEVTVKIITGPAGIKFSVHIYVSCCSRYGTVHIDQSRTLHLHPMIAPSRVEPLA